MAMPSAAWLGLGLGLGLGSGSGSGSGSVESRLVSACLAALRRGLAQAEGAPLEAHDARDLLRLP
eukprot:scaffold56428_cov36-Phaeocystis_antarctica.AAC.1